MRGLDGFLVAYGYTLIWTITLIQVTALVVSAVRQSTTVLAEIDREDQEHDLLRLVPMRPTPSIRHRSLGPRRQAWRDF